MFHIIIIIFYCHIHLSNAYADLVNYYEELISAEINQANLYQFPNNSEYFKQNQTSESVIDFGNFDFIIVGGGSAGCVLANRLSENKIWNILLLEAGKYENAFSDIPAFGPTLQLSRMNWGYQTIPQNNSCLGFVGKQCPIARGKVLGGSSIINAMAYVRGNRIDYNRWQRLGNDGWSYKNVLPYFKKSENSKIKSDFGYHSVGGLLNVEYSRPESPILKTIITGHKELGQQELDYNGRRQVGVAKQQKTIINGARDSAAKAFLTPVSNRSNLHIITNTLVLKILLNAKSAYGVKFIKNGQLYVARAQKEIILSAGAINSPQLLMLSGVGPRHHLDEKGIEVVHELEGVGQNLQDHVMFSGFRVETNYTENRKNLTTDIINYLQGEGDLTYYESIQVINFKQTKKCNLPDYPDVEMLCTLPNGLSVEIPRSGVYDQQTTDNYFAKINPQNSIGIAIVVLHPKSRGSVSLASNQPYDFPIIDPQYLSQQEDVETMYRGIEYSLKLLHTKSFQKLNATLLKYQLPACKDFEYLSKGYWVCTMKQLSLSIDHAAGTCKMGPKSDDGAVVNNELKVYGIKKLRVVDASVMPLLISGHTGVPVYMIAEKASDLIKREYSK